MSSNPQQVKGKKKANLNSVISWGASVVIIGLMFKILHLKGGEIMIAVGLMTESILFAIMGFAAMAVPEEKHDEKQPDNLGELLSSAITPKIVERLGKGFEQFSKTVETVNVVANAAPITQAMLKEIETTTGDFKKFRDQMNGTVTSFDQFGKTMQSMNQMSGAASGILKDFEAAHTGMKTYVTNITAMNASFDQFNKTMQSINSVAASSQAMVKEFETATNGMKAYNKALMDLSRVYQAQLDAFKK